MILTNYAPGTHRLRCDSCGRGPNDRTVSETRFADRSVWLCHRCGAAGVKRDPLHSIVMPRPARTVATAAPLEWSTVAESIWRRTQGLRGTLGEVYLRHRGCCLPPRDSHLRYLPLDGEHGPTLVAAITDARTAKPIRLHFTRLAADGRGKAGTDRDKTMLKGHRKAGGVIRLWPDEAVTYSLGIAEGIETALSLAHGHAPVWACIDAGNLRQFPVLDGLETLLIATDADAAGIDAAVTCADRWADAGKNVLLVAPAEVGADLNDVVSA